MKPSRSQQSTITFWMIVRLETAASTLGRFDSFGNQVNRTNTWKMCIKLKKMCIFPATTHKTEENAHISGHNYERARDSIMPKQKRQVGTIASAYYATFKHATYTD